MSAPDIAALEDRRYAAMRAGDVDALRELMSARLHYSHSLGDRDTLDSYLAKVAAGHFVYRRIDHVIDWMESLPGAVTLGGRMTADVVVAGANRHIDNAFLAVWAEEGGAWRLIAYQPTPLPATEPRDEDTTKAT
ncbi:nuclear transport factor 2 family protein [Paracoccus sp. S1E-3]|uniref:nuclear transport factor 2 family protein n=1 Tax=Paracoccus sp. S1E-3 TaxID=2756130 RepID=UPI0015EFDC06|nr:nuclear transport factor 2 family protein [Paracoccus sp. S1E-3]MBA4489814.1 nuclear transport factor 2 family protein [Paracoccus sp. S1E-3]